MAAGGFFLTSLACLIVAVTSWPRPCEKPPFWTINGEDIMAKEDGNITIVTLLSASCPVCLWQTEALERMAFNLIRSNHIGITYHIINSKHEIAQMYISELTRRATTIPVYQDNEKEKVWETLEGGKDDLYIYDRCGRLTFYLPYPYSLLFYPYTMGGILSTYYDNPCGPCPLPNEEKRNDENNFPPCEEVANRTVQANTTNNNCTMKQEGDLSHFNETKTTEELAENSNLTATNYTEAVEPDEVLQKNYSNKTDERLNQTNFTVDNDTEVIHTTTPSIETKNEEQHENLNMTETNNDASNATEVDIIDANSNYTAENETVYRNNSSANETLLQEDRSNAKNTSRTITRPPPLTTLKDIFENINNYEEALNYALRYWFMANLDVKTYERHKLQLMQQTTTQPPINTLNGTLIDEPSNSSTNRKNTTDSKKDKKMNQNNGNKNPKRPPKENKKANHNKPNTNSEPNDKKPRNEKRPKHQHHRHQEPDKSPNHYHHHAI